MRVFKHFIASLLIINSFFMMDLISQDLSSPIMPADIPKDSYLGFVFGVGQNYQSGKFFVDCENCEFENGVQTGITFGLTYKREIIKNLNWGAMLLYDSYNIESKFKETEVFKYEFAAEQDAVNIPIEFRHIAKADFSMLSLNPFIEVTPLSFLFARIGFNAGFVVGANINHQKELLTRKAKLENGVTVDIKLADSKETIEVVEDGEFPEINSFQMALTPMIGFIIPFSKSVFFSPYYLHRIPLNKMSEFGEDFKVNSYRIMLELSFKL